MQSVVAEPIGFGGDLSFDSILLNFAQVGDELPKWGTEWRLRDRLLREFWITEPTLAGAITSTVAKYCAFGWTLFGPPRTVGIVHAMLQNVEFGSGWQTLFKKMLLDYFCSDNGAFGEIIREADDPRAPVVSLKQLDSAACVRTGRHETPIIYYDINGKGHLMKDYQVFEWVDMPSPDQRARGIGYCAVSRVLRDAQKMRDLGIFDHEKISGRRPRAIHVVSGVTRKAVDDSILQQRERDLGEGMRMYTSPAILATVDPTARVSHEIIELATVPAGFSRDDYMRWYINILANALEADYQDLAPLPGGNLGTAQQANVLHRKARGKGPALWMSMVEQRFNYHGILPRTVKFKFGEQDIGEDAEKAEVSLTRAKERAERIKSGEITPEVAAQLAHDSGDLAAEYLTALGGGDLTPNIQMGSGG